MDIHLRLTLILRSIYVKCYKRLLLGEWPLQKQSQWRSREYDFPEVGKKDMYLLHHEEIESLAKNIPGVKWIRFFGPLDRLLNPYEMSGKRMLSTS